MAGASPQVQTLLYAASIMYMGSHQSVAAIGWAGRAQTQAKTMEKVIVDASMRWMRWVSGGEEASTTSRFVAALNVACLVAVCVCLWLCRRLTVIILTAYGIVIALGALAASIEPAIASLCSEETQEVTAFRVEEDEIQLGSRIFFLPFSMPFSFDLTLPQAVANALALGTLAAYIGTGSEMLHNIFAVAFATRAIAVISLGRFSVLFLVLGAVFAYDVYWTVNGEAYVSAAMQLDGPFKILVPAARVKHPSLAPPGPVVWVLGDVAIPGVLTAMCLRFESSKEADDEESSDDSEDDDEVEDSDDEANARRGRVRRGFVGRLRKRFVRSVRCVRRGLAAAPLFWCVYFSYLAMMSVILTIVMRPRRRWRPGSIEGGRGGSSGSWNLWHFAIEPNAPLLLYILPVVMTVCIGVAAAQGRLQELLEYSENQVKAPGSEDEALAKREEGEEDSASEGVRGAGRDESRAEANHEAAHIRDVGQGGLLSLICSIICCRRRIAEDSDYSESDVEESEAEAADGDDDSDEDPSASPAENENSADEAEEISEEESNSQQSLNSQALHRRSGARHRGQTPPPAFVRRRR
eukprot:TRINITY_DN38139_c0_g1_i1.p1 TRINITY_DN38139_c0_g1~~TRINITY_DN38139_c0_g1_i1.p1  ORF type:complete len:630 (+),score=121.67 TRINITY_DN38139_c0_g1_i1:152-1891(+)